MKPLALIFLFCYFNNPCIIWKVIYENILKIVAEQMNSQSVNFSWSVISFKRCYALPAWKVPKELPNSNIHIKIKENLFHCENKRKYIDNPHGGEDEN